MNTLTKAGQYISYTAMQAYSGLRSLGNEVIKAWDKIGTPIGHIIQRHPKKFIAGVIGLSVAAPFIAHTLDHVVHNLGHLDPIGLAHGESDAASAVADSSNQGIINVKVNDHPYDLRIFTDPGHQIQPTVNRTPDGFQIVFTNLKGDDVDGFYFFAHNNRYDFNDEILSRGSQTVVVPDIVPKNLPSDVYQQQEAALSKELIGAASAGTAGAICTGLTVQRLFRRKRK